MITQSVGVPATACVRSSSLRSRSGVCSVIECDVPDWFVSGATVHTSRRDAERDAFRISSPWALMPSSLVIRMRMCSFSASGDSLADPASR